jgi:hypothetical protein
MSKANGRGAASPTSPLVWRKPYTEGELVEFPSGNIARVKPMSLDTLIRLGRVPNVLLGLIATDLIGKTEAEAPLSTEEVTAELIKMMDTLVLTMFMEPRAVEEDPGEDEISVDMVSLEDKQFLMQLVLDGSHKLRSFRPGQVEPVAVVPPDPDHWNPAEPAVTSTPVVE